jgi:GNAT superfamily N-acetyltransferase
LSTYSIVPFDKQYLPAFIALNKDWIQHYFAIEHMDLLQLEHAEEEILSKGGEILFVLVGDDVVATCAMVPHGPDCYELAKMAVDRKHRGHGYGDILMEEAIRWAKNKNAKRIMLLSNTILTPAITLYKKHGFKTVHLGDHPDYERCNIEMELSLEPH